MPTQTKRTEKPARSEAFTPSEGVPRGSVVDSPIRVHEMRVIWRDTFIVDDAPPSFIEASRDKLRRMRCYAADSLIEEEHAMPELLRVINRVSRSVAPMGHPSLLRVQFAPIQFANLRPTLSKHKCAPERLTIRQIKDAGIEADDRASWMTATPILLLHAAGVGIMSYHVTLTSADGFTPDQAIEQVRMGIYSQLVMMDDTWRGLLPDKAAEWPVEHVLNIGANRHLLICGLRDVTQGVIASRLGAKINVPDPTPNRRRIVDRIRRKESDIEVLPPRPTGSASIVLVNVDPVPGEDFDAYCSEHSAALRGIGAMDSYWRNRAAWLIDRELGDNLSTDSEMGLYLLGSSELLLFNEGVKAAAADDARRLRLSDVSYGVTYFYTHYTTMMEWVYMQEALLKWYLRRADSIIAATKPHRRQMISTVQGALRDLVQYQEDVTPFSTRIEFLQRAAEYRKLDVLSERFEKKQERLIEYTGEYYDYREARASEFLNWLAGILTGAALAELIVTLFGLSITADPTSRLIYMAIYGASILFVLAIMTFLLRRV